jgi:TonB-dependent starch-binding outer membrane protein SusC
MRPTRFGVAGLLLAVLMGLAPFGLAAQAQVGRVQGKISDAANGAPISDVQVIVTGSALINGNTGGLSRATGAFVIINVPAGTYELKAEKIGYATFTKQITVAAGGIVDETITLSQAALGLDEIIVTGTAGAAKRREVGNQVATISPADLPERPTSVMSMLQAQAPGMDVSTTGGGGEIGEGFSITLRGTNQIGGAGSQPVIFIDGVRIFSSGLPTTGTPDLSTNSSNTRPNPLGMINPNDIERIEVISGPAASTLYGTEAAGGVIQVFTKKGTSRAPTWSLDSSVGTLWNQAFGMNGLDYLHLEPWMCSGPFECGLFMRERHGLVGAPTTLNQSLSVRGGGQALQYFISGGFDNEQGNTPKDYLQRYNVRGNFTLNPLEDVVLTWNTAYSHSYIDNTSSGNNAGGLVLNAMRQDQGYFGTADSTIINTAITDWDIQQTIERVTTGATIQYTPLEKMTNRLTVGYDMTQQEARNIRHVGFRLFPQGGIDVDVYTRRYLSFDYVGSYSFDLLNNLTSAFSWGGQATGDFTADLEGFGEGFPGSKAPTINSASSTLSFETRSTTWNSGFFLQDVLGLKDKYFLTLGLRVDGNSTFGKNFGLQFYPKASGSWVLSDETFWPERFGEMKLRAAYGVSGRAPSAIASRRTWNNTALAGSPAFTPGNRGNPDLGPEVTDEIEMGFDASWFTDRLRPRLTYYHQHTTDAIQNQSGIPSLGFTSAVSFNLGETENWGYEVAVDGTAFRNKDWGLDLGYTWSRIGSRILTWNGSSDPNVEVNVGRPINNTGPVTLYYNPEGMGGNRQSNGTYQANSCTQTLYEIGPAGDTINSVLVERPGIDPTIMACTYSSANLGSWGYENGRRISGSPVLMGANVNLRMPYGISLAARAEYKGGHGYTRSINPVPLGRNVRSPACYPYYLDKTSVVVRTDAPAIWASRCATSGSNYTIKGEFANIRSISASVPMDWAFPDRVSSANLTLVMNNVFHFTHSMWGNYTAGQERVPESTSLRAALRVTF